MGTFDLIRRYGYPAGYFRTVCDVYVDPSVRFDIPKTIWGNSFVAYPPSRKYYYVHDSEITVHGLGSALFLPLVNTNPEKQYGLWNMNLSARHCYAVIVHCKNYCANPPKFRYDDATN